MYQALYRKYRPQTFDDVVGQSGVTDTLKAQLVSQKLSHAYLFTGTRGTGKTSCAKILAKAVNCLEPQDGNPCNHCAACKAIDSGSCVDVLEIDAASNNGVDHVRALRDDAVYSPSQVRKRVYIVDEVHMLSISAFNALLKIIEEPPEHLLFILATTELHKVPATILSRCQRFSFRRLRAEDIASRLNRVAYEEGIELEDDAAELLASLADGALRDGLSLLDQCASASGGKVTAQQVRDTLGLAGERNTAELLSAIGSGNGERALELFSRVYDAGKDLSAFLGELSALARDLLMLKIAPKSGMGMLSGMSGKAERSALLERFSPAELLRIISLVQKTASGFATSANRRLDTELCLMELCSPALSADPTALSARIGRVEERLASGCAVSSAPVEELPEEPVERREEPMPEETEPEPPVDELPPGFWPEFYEQIKDRLPPPIRGLLSPGGALRPSYRGGVLYLEGSSGFAEKLLDEATLRFLSQRASAALGGQVKVSLNRGKFVGAEEDPMEELLRMGDQHKDIFHIQN